MKYILKNVFRIIYILTRAWGGLVLFLPNSYGVAYLKILLPPRTYILEISLLRRLTFSAGHSVPVINISSHMDVDNLVAAARVVVLRPGVRVVHHDVDGVLVLAAERCQKLRLFFLTFRDVWLNHSSASRIKRDICRQSLTK